MCVGSSPAYYRNIAMVILEPSEQQVDEGRVDVLEHRPVERSMVAPL